MNLFSCHKKPYTRLPLFPPFFLHPSWGKGVVSSMIPILNPNLERALTAAFAPGPVFVGPLCPPGALTLMWRALMPFSRACSAAIFAAFIAAVGEDSMRCALTTMPPDAFPRVSLPDKSVR